MRQRLLVVTFAVGAVLASAGTLGASELWLHVRVDEDGPRDTRVRVNLPFSLIERALPLVPDLEPGRHDCWRSHGHQGTVRIDGEEIGVEELREMLANMESAADGTRFQHEMEWETVTYYKDRDLVRLETRNRKYDDDVSNIRVPLGLVRSLIAPEGQTVSFREVSRWLVERGEGEILLVDDDRTRVRVWVDDSPGSDSWSDQ